MHEFQAPRVGERVMRKRRTVTMFVRKPRRWLAASSVFTFVKRSLPLLEAHV